MPTDWQYSYDGAQTSTKVRRDIAGELVSIVVDLDSYATRRYTEDEYEELSEVKKKKLHWVEDEEIWEEFGEGAHGAIQYTVDDEGYAEFAGYKDETYSDDSYNDVRWMRLIPVARKIIERVPGVEEVEDPAEIMADELDTGNEMRALM